MESNPMTAMTQFFSFVGWIIFFILMIIIANNTGKTAKYTRRISEQMFRMNEERKEK